MPANLSESDRFTRFFVSNFSRSELVRPPQSTRLKFPLSIERLELRGLYGADIESGGFGPLYGACCCWPASAESRCGPVAPRDRLAESS